MSSRLPRGPIKATYTRASRRARRGRGGRSKAAGNAQSSPLEEIDREDITRSEMKRRMLKRSRSIGQSMVSEENINGLSLAPSEPQARSKRQKHNRDAELIASNTMSIHDLNPYHDDSQFETPFMSSVPQNPPVIQAAPPERFSPVPVARRLLSRTSSRNLKENPSRRSGALASPFNSRPGSAASSPKHKSMVKSRRIPLAPSRTLSRASNENAEQREPVFTMNHSSQKSSTSKGHHRFGSNPNSSHIFQQVTQDDWLVRPKVLTRSPPMVPNHIVTPPELAVGSSSFLRDAPEAYSTPAPKRRRVDTMDSSVSRLYAPHNSSPVVVDIADQHFSYEQAFAREHNRALDDVEMAGEDSRRARKYPLPRNSIFDSPSCDFTLGRDKESLHGDPLFSEAAMDGVQSIALLDSGDTRAVRTHTTKVSLGDHDVLLSAMTSSPPDFSLYHSLPARDLAPTLRLSAEGGDERRVASSPEATGPLSPRTELKDIFSSLLLSEGEWHTNSDEELSHHDPILGSALITTRARSLDGSVPLITAGNDTTTGRHRATASPRHQIKTRNRRGTIRASDFNRPGTSTVPTIDTAPVPHARRTRSGTVVGPSYKSAVRMLAPVPLPNEAPLVDADVEEDDELLLKSGWCDGDWELSGRPLEAGESKPLEQGQDMLEDGSDDELDFLASGYKDEWEL